MENIEGTGNHFESEAVAVIRLIHADGRDSTDGLFLPGEEITVEVSWTPQPSCRGFDLRLLWETEGKGTEDSEILLQEKWQSELRGEMKRSFQWKLPRGPLSCEGTLLRIRWHIDCYINPADIRARRDLVISNQGCAVQLPKGEHEGEIANLLKRFKSNEKTP